MYRTTLEKNSEGKLIQVICNPYNYKCYFCCREVKSEKICVCRKN